ISGIDILNGKITIDPNGNFTSSGSITTSKVNVENSDVSAASAGEVVLKAGQTSIDVNTSILTNKSLIFATPDIPLAVGAAKKDNSTITISISKAQSNDI